MAKNIDAYDAAHEAGLKLRAMLAVTYGSQGETFRNLSDDLQDCFLWACYDQIVLINEAIEAMAETGQG
jgi:hypothetical protein